VLSARFVRGFSRYGAYKHFLAYDYSNVTVEAYMASVIALESEALSTKKNQMGGY
jgi:hypothetical protein